MNTKIMTDRQTVLDKIREEPEVSVLIVGGGIVGTGLFRDLALQGVDVLLAERGDVSCGTSAGPSRMVHGGVRYLEFGEVRLVKESVKERNILLQVAPHYVFPLPTTIPILGRFDGLGSLIRRWLGMNPKRGPSRGSVIIRLGLMLYDFLSRKNRRMPKHHFSSRKASLAKRSKLRSDIKCTATYYDGWVSYPERLALELLLDGEALCPDARAVNYLSLESGEGDAVSLRDELSGDTIRVKPKILVNATGPWIDKANRKLGIDKPMISGTKGAHLILDNDELYKQFAEGQIFYETPDARVSITVPWNGKPMIGSTDIKVDDPDEARVDDDEIDYILGAVRVAFPDVKVDRSQILSAFTGVRPLRRSDAATTGQMSRAHHCDVEGPSDKRKFPVYSMVGGKWTPFRGFAEMAANKVLTFLGKRRRDGTEALAIGGGKNFPEGDDAKKRWAAGLAEKTGLSEERLLTLLTRFGTRAEPVAKFCTEGDDQPLKHHAGYTRREIEFMVLHEKVYHLDDLLLRRTAIALLGELTSDLLSELADIMAPLIGWSDEDKMGDVARTKEILTDKFMVKL